MVPIVPSDFAAQLNADEEMTREESLERYRDRKNVGGKQRYGSQGCVHRATDAFTGDAVALKLVNLGANPAKQSATLSEVAALRKLRACDHVIGLRRVIYSHTEAREESPGTAWVYLVLDLMPAVLTDVMFVKDAPLSREVVRRYARGIFLGLAECHAAGILHGDIKPDNLLIDGSGDIKIADFGVSEDMKKWYNTPEEIPCAPWGTMPYTAPERILCHAECEPSIDIWSAGMVVMEMCTGAHIVQERRHLDHVLKLFSILGSPSLEEFGDYLSASHMWSPLLPVFEPSPTAFDRAREMGVECVARKSFAIVPSKRSTAAALADELVEETCKRSKVDDVAS